MSTETTETAFTPDSDLFPGHIERPVYKLLQIQVAAFFGGPLAATYMIARNFTNLDQPELVRKTWLSGIGATIVYFTIAFSMPRHFSFLNYVLTFGMIYSVTAIVKKWQAARLAEHVGQGGKVNSGWNCFAVIIVSVLCLSAVLAPYYIYLAYSLFPNN